MTWVTYDPIYRSKIEVTRLINAVTESQPYFGTGRPTNFTDFIYLWGTMICITNMSSVVQAESSGWSFKSSFAGVGACCGSTTAGHTTCYT